MAERPKTDCVHPRLEVIDRGRASECHPVPLLFVHGAWHAAWCWDEHFLGFFAERGYHAVAVSLRGHGGSAAGKPLRRCTLSDYVEDVSGLAAALPRHPVVIGHSMGGLVVLKYLESRPAPASVLLAPTYPLAYLGTGLRWFRRHPWHFAKIAATGKSLPYVSTAELARERFFSSHTPESDVRDYSARLQEESGRIGFDAVLSFPRPGRVATRLLVLGACDDASVTRRAVRATARAHGVDAEFFPDMGHDMMLEPGWRSVAERMDTWLGGIGL